MSDLSKSRRDVLKAGAAAAAAAAVVVPGKVEATTASSVSTADVPVFRFRHTDGTVMGLDITPDILEKEPGLQQLLGRLKGTRLAADTYEKGMEHDKEHNKGTDYDKSFSRS